MIAAKAFRCAVKAPALLLSRSVIKGFAGSNELGHISRHHPLNCSSDLKDFDFDFARKNFFSSLAVADSYYDEGRPDYIRILFGSQGGTAQLLAMQLSEELEELDCHVEVMALNDASTPAEHLQPGKALHVFIISVSGVGEPPNNARDFYKWLMNDTNTNDAEDNAFGLLKYAVFGLGNQKAHPNHYNVIGKNLDKKLEELGANRFFPLGLGNDGECLEDDFDTWRDQFLKTIKQIRNGYDDSNDGITTNNDKKESEVAVAAQANDASLRKEGVSSTTESSRRISDKFPVLQLHKNPSPVVCKDDLFHLDGTAKPFYQEGTSRLAVTSNRLLSANAGESGLRELRISLKGDETQRYEAGDHLVVYPRNASCFVEAYLNILDVDPNTIIEEPDTGSSRQRAYPHPLGITLHETLSHCVDLGALPSPPFSRLLLGRQDIDYKDQIVGPRTTTLELIQESGHIPSMEELMYNLPPIKPRYYSIASSPLVHPDEVFVTYRPVKYVTSRGHLREGLCTSHMSHLGVGETSSSHVAASIHSNPTFRLPKDTQTPVLMIAGGCGIAPIRAFLEERIALAGSSVFGKGHLYLGFRSPTDEVYRPIIQQAQDCGAITDVSISYSTGCSSPSLVSTTVRDHGAEVFALLQDGGFAYMCGGARAFGAAVEREILTVFQEHGKMGLDDATEYLRKLISEGRLCEDLAD